jgi:hypothetical protein
MNGGRMEALEVLLTTPMGLDTLLGNVSMPASGLPIS